jgi:hypothetical protein
MPTLTNTTITGATLNTAVALTQVGATEDSTNVYNTGNTFTFTPTKAGSKILLLIETMCTKAVEHGSVSIAAGDLWAGKAITGAFGDTVGDTTLIPHLSAIQFDSARVLQDDGTILVTVYPTPAGSSGSSVMLITDHNLKMYAIEML